MAKEQGRRKHENKGGRTGNSAPPPAVPRMKSDNSKTRKTTVTKTQPFLTPQEKHARRRGGGEGPEMRKGIEGKFPATVLEKPVSGIFCGRWERGWGKKSRDDVSRVLPEASC